jgi:uncharacterized protein (TIGR03437 family)
MTKLVRSLTVAALYCTMEAATFGTRVPIAGGPIDLVYDEWRQQLYLVDFNTNSVLTYSIPGRRFLAPIRVGLQPISAAISPDGRHLYVTNYQTSSISVVDLERSVVVRNVNLPVRPEGIAVGADGKVLVTTLGQGPANNQTDTLIVFDPEARDGQEVRSVLNPPIPTAAPPVALTPGRIYLNFRGRLQATPDRQLIIGVNTPAQNDTLVFVYEVASQKVLRIRRVPGLSTVLSVSPDGKRFMAGARMFDVATLNVLATQDTNNAPFLLNAAQFNLAQNNGGSVFMPDGLTLYSAFNIAPLVIGQNRPNATTLLVNNPRNLAIRMGIQLPESVLGKMVAAPDGQNVYALSESGLLVLPVGQLNTFPILEPESTVVRLSANQCQRGAATRALPIRNAGRGTLRYTVQAVAANTGLQVQPEGLATPNNLRLTMNPATTRRIGSTLTQVLLLSEDAINIPPIIRVYQNWLNAETRTTTLPMETGLNAQEGLTDLALDNARQRVYISNSPKNQVEVYDIRRQAFLDPIEVGQFPRSMALANDGRTLYVANAGGEWISKVDLEEGREYDRIGFPPTPFNASQAPVTPRVIALGIYGLQIWASTSNTAAGTLWSASGRTAVLRPLSNAMGTTTIPAPVSMVSTPGNESIMLLAGNNTAYLYDSLADDFVLARTVMQAPVVSYYGVVGAGPEGRYFLANRAILNQTLVPVGGFAGGIVVQPPGGTPTPGPTPAPTPTPTPRPGGASEEEGDNPEQQVPPGAGGGQIPPGQIPPGQIPPGQIPPGQVPPGQVLPPQIQVTPATLRNVAAVYPINTTLYARFSTAQQANANANPTGNPQPMIEIVNVNTEQVMGTAPLAEAPAMQVFGNQRANLSGRLMAVDNRAQFAYVVTMSGLSIAPLAAGQPPERITLNQRGIVQAATYGQDLAPGGLFSIFGQGMGELASAGSLPLPTQLGGICVTFNDTPVPLIVTSPNQINGQVPPNFRAGTYQVIVRSAERALASNAGQARVVAAAPGVFVTGNGEAALFHADDYSLVTQQDPARRDEVLVLFATGIPPAQGVTLQPGAPAPANPLATTQRVKVFIGDPKISESEMIVEWSGFAPGFVGLNQVIIRVHGDRIRGDKLPLSIQVGTVSSPLTGAAVPVTYVR